MQYTQENQNAKNAAFGRFCNCFPFPFSILFNFGDNFMQWIKLFHNDIQSCIVVNGHLSDNTYVVRLIHLPLHFNSLDWNSCTPIEKQ